MKPAPTYPSVIVSTSRNPHAIALVLEALRLQIRAPAEILIADDGSDERTAKLIEKTTPRLRCTLRHFWQPHEGFRKTIIVNRAVAAATGDYLVFLDGDCMPDRRFVSDHLKLAAPGVFVQGRRGAIREGFVGQVNPGAFDPLLWYLAGRLHGFRYAVRRWRPTVRINDLSFVQGSNLAMWRDDFFRVNGYDEAFAGWGHEDADLAHRLRNAGLTCKTVIGRAIVYHLDHPLADRSQTAENSSRLELTKRERRTWCEQGVARGTPAPRR